MIRSSNTPESTAWTPTDPHPEPQSRPPTAWAKVSIDTSIRTQGRCRSACHTASSCRRKRCRVREMHRRSESIGGRVDAGAGLAARCESPSPLAATCTDSASTPALSDGTADASHSGMPITTRTTKRPHPSINPTRGSWVSGAMARASASSWTLPQDRVPPFLMEC